MFKKEVENIGDGDNNVHELQATEGKKIQSWGRVTEGDRKGVMHTFMWI